MRENIAINTSIQLSDLIDLKDLDGSTKLALTMAEITTPGNYILKFKIDGIFTISIVNNDENGVFIKNLLQDQNPPSISSKEGSYKLLLPKVEVGTIVFRFSFYNGTLEDQFRNITNIEIYKQ